MKITVSNYASATGKMDFSKLSDALKQGHKYMTEFGDLYDDDAQIKKAIDTYLDALNKETAKEAPKAPEAPKRPEMSEADKAKFLKKLEAQKERPHGDMQPYSRIYDRLLKIFPDLDKITDADLIEGIHVKKKQSGYNDLVVEAHYRNDAGRIVLILAHYYTQQGDLMSAPRMDIAVDTKMRIAEALVYEAHNTNPQVYKEVYPEPGKVNLYEKKAQNEFLSQWLKNIIDQGWGPINLRPENKEEPADDSKTHKAVIEGKKANIEMGLPKLRKLYDELETAGYRIVSLNLKNAIAELEKGNEAAAKKELEVFRDILKKGEGEPTGTKHTYRLGDMWSEDFDYDGMIAAGKTAVTGMGLPKLRKLYASFVDVNYHKDARHLGEAIEALEKEDEELAMKHIEQFQKRMNNMEEESPLTCPPVDADGKRRTDMEGLELLHQCIEEHPKTKGMHLVNGEYTTERKALHAKIIEHFTSEKPCITHDKPIAILTGGPPGSGKSHFLKTFAPWITSKNMFHIDADEVRAKLPEYKGWNADSTQDETKDITNALIDHIGDPCEHDLIYDGTMNKAKNYIPLVDKLKKLGYQVFVIYLQVPYELSYKRAMERYQRTGRYVPKFVIDEVYERGLEAFETVIKHADGFIRVNGETGEIVEKGGKQIPTDRNYELEDCHDCDTKKEAHKEAKAAKQKPVNVATNPKLPIVKVAGDKAGMQALLDNAIKSPDEWSMQKVISEGQKFEELRRQSSQINDENKDTLKRLSPTRENLIRWMKNPGQFDLIGVDNWKADDPTADLKIRKEVFWAKLGFKI